MKIEIGGGAHVLTSDRGGYVHAEIQTELPPGWHDAIVTVHGRDPVSSRVRVVDGRAMHGVVSDIDDTILVTWLPRPCSRRGTASSSASTPVDRLKV